MFNKHELKFEMFVAVLWSDGLWIFALVYSSIPSFKGIFSVLKCRLLRRNLRYIYIYIYKLATIVEGNQKAPF